MLTPKLNLTGLRRSPQTSPLDRPRLKELHVRHGVQTLSWSILVVGLRWDFYVGDGLDRTYDTVTGEHARTMTKDMERLKVKYIIPTKEGERCTRGSSRWMGCARGRTRKWLLTWTRTGKSSSSATWNMVWSPSASLRTKCSSPRPRSWTSSPSATSAWRSTPSWSQNCWTGQWWWSGVWLLEPELIPLLKRGYWNHVDLIRYAIFVWVPCILSLFWLDCPLNVLGLSLGMKK